MVMVQMELSPMIITILSTIQSSPKNKEILRLNNPQNRHKIFYELSRDKRDYIYS